MQLSALTANSGAAGITPAAPLFLGVLGGCLKFGPNLHFRGS
jgi:hypothetical protein